MILESEIVGCILAGGKSSRMGSDKSLLKFGGVSLIERAATVMRGVFASVVISSDRTNEYPFLGLPVLPDIRKNCGPLGGIHSVFVQTTSLRLFVLACDMPFVSPELIRYIVDTKAEANAMVPLMGGRLHPLCALYSRTGFPIIERSLDHGEFRLQGVLKEMKHQIVPVTSDLPFYSPHLLDNLNEQDDIEQARYTAGNVITSPTNGAAIRSSQ